MRCTWRDIATYVDAWYSPVFFGCIVAIFALFLWGSLAEHRRFGQWLRDTGRDRYLAALKFLYVAVAFLLVWPMVSPTFCENMKCAGNNGLKPRTECLPQDALEKYPRQGAAWGPGTRQFEAGGLGASPRRPVTRRRQWAVGPWTASLVRENSRFLAILFPAYERIIGKSLQETFLTCIAQLGVLIPSAGATQCKPEIEISHGVLVHT